MRPPTTAQFKGFLIGFAGWIAMVTIAAATIFITNSVIIAIIIQVTIMLLLTKHITRLEEPAPWAFNLGIIIPTIIAIITLTTLMYLL